MEVRVHVVRAGPPAVAGRIGAENVVVGEQMMVPHSSTPDVRPQHRGIGPDLGLREDHADAHAGYAISVRDS